MSLLKNTFSKFHTKKNQPEIENQSKAPVAKRSFSQSGEDLIIDYIFMALGIEKPSYIDIGAYHPFDLSNTALMYEKGSSGINVEPNAEHFKLFERDRPRDKNVNAGIAEEPGSLTYYEFDTPTLNTFSKEEAENIKSNGFKIIGENIVNVQPLEDIIADHFGSDPYFMNMDIEGLEHVIVNSMKKISELPLVICAETVEFCNDLSGKKNQELIQSIVDLGYRVYADTHINTIFLKSSV